MIGIDLLLNTNNNENRRMNNLIKKIVSWYLIIEIAIWSINKSLYLKSTFIHFKYQFNN